MSAINGASSAGKRTLGAIPLRLRMKGQYVYECLMSWQNPPASAEGRVLRDWLLRIKGIGLKTASWIVRNWLDSDDVAILDIHIFRAGLLAGFFNGADSVERDYIRMENRFLAFAHALGARASILDAIIWWQMKQAGSLAHQAIARYDCACGKPRRAA